MKIGMEPAISALKSPRETDNSQALQQEDFLALLTQQLAQQDPFKPVSNEQMIAQMASFATVEGINKINEQLSNLGQGEITPSDLLGKVVLVESGDVWRKDGQSIQGQWQPERLGQSVTLIVEDALGTLVHQEVLSAEGLSAMPFSWPNSENNGAILDGNYRFTLVDTEQKNAVPVQTYQKVTYVTLNEAGRSPQLVLEGGQVSELSAVKGIGMPT